jgi:Family of unknown function (DUF5681)
MSAPEQKQSLNEYDVGYGKPPARSRFRKEQSGNPGGRPRGMTTGRAQALILKEAYRVIRLREGDTVLELPALQVVLRSMITRAAKGSGPLQRAVIAFVREIERESAAQARANGKDQAAPRKMSDLEIARRIAYLLSPGMKES